MYSLKENNAYLIYRTFILKRIYLVYQIRNIDHCINFGTLLEEILNFCTVFFLWCSIIGSVVVVIGLYVFLWSKSKQIDDCEINKLPTNTVEAGKEEEDHTNVNKLGNLLVIPMTPWSNLYVQLEGPTCHLEKSLKIWKRFWNGPLNIDQRILSLVVQCLSSLEFAFLGAHLDIVIYLYK